MLGAAANLEASLVRYLDKLAQRTPEELIAERRHKCRNIGTFTEESA